MAASTTEGFYCSTSGTVFTTKDELNEHYRSDFHRYNLRRKVAGLPPVSLEWFEARKEQLRNSSAAAQKGTRQWVEPLTKKKFASEATYQAFIGSKKYEKLLRDAGLTTPPDPVVVVKRTEPVEQAATPAAGPADADEEADDGNDSGWETASDDEEQWEQWDVRRSLFDNHMSNTFAENLEYMFKKYGFYLPDAEYLTDAEGLLQYLGQKLQYGHVPLYISGDDANAKSFRSLHAVQRHMVDAGKCKMLYDGNEEEYADFYDYEDGASQGDMDEDEQAGSSERGNGAPGKVLGSRDLAVYYKQRHRPEDMRASTSATALVAAYRRLGVATAHKSDDVEAARARKALAQANKLRLKAEMRNAVINKLPKNVTF